MLVGPDYETIVNMDYLSATRPAPAPAPTLVASPPVILAPLSSVNQPRGPLQGIGSLGLVRPPVAGVKRKLPLAEVDIIDLTGDD